MSELRVTLFGGMTTTYNGRPLTYRTSKVQALYLYLLMESTQQHHRERLMELLWPGLPEQSARGNLRQTLYLLRKMLPENSIEATRSHIYIHPDAQYTTDVTDALIAIECVKKHDHDKLIRCPDCFTRLTAAAVHIIGSFADGFSLYDSNQFEDWLTVTCQMVRRESVFVLNTVAKMELELGNHQSALQYARQHLAIDPDSEEAYQNTMLAYYQQGKRLEALKVHGDCCIMLDKVWGLPPSSETVRIRNLIRTKEESNKKDKTEDDDELPLQTFVVGPPIKDPRQFFGRKRELKRIKQWLTHKPLSHIALVGQPRSGKTSVRHYLPHLLTDICWVHVDFQDPSMVSLSRLLRYLLTQFGITPPEEACTLAQFVELCRAHNWKRPTVVLMDELSAGLAAPELTQQFWWMLRSLVNTSVDCPLAFVVAAHDSPTILAEAVDKISPFFNMFNTVLMKPFTETEAQELIESSPIPFSAADITWIIEKTKLWPYFLQKACQERLTALEDGDMNDSWKQNTLSEIARHNYLI